MAVAPLFWQEGPPWYGAAFAHNSPFATAGPYNLALSDSDESDFRTWVEENLVPFDPSATTVDYDMRRYWLVVIKPGGTWTHGDHFPDTYKTPYDTSFSSESMYATMDNPFDWTGDKLFDTRDGTLVFWADYVPPKAKVVVKSKSAQRSNVPVNFWTKKGPNLHFGLEKWRVWWVPRTGARKGIGHLVENLSWIDETAILTGEIHFREPSFGNTGITNGDEIMLEAALDGGDSFTELWRMRAYQDSKEYAGDTKTLQVMNALGWLARSKDDFKYVKNKQHPNGWLAHEIALDVCRRYSIPVAHGLISEGKHRIKRLVFTSTSPLKVIAEAYKREAVANARFFVFGMQHGQLTILPLQRNSRMLELGATLLDAMFQQTMQESFATALTVRSTARRVVGKDKKGRTRKAVSKVVVKVQSAGAIQRFGYIHRNITTPDADSAAEARQIGLRHMVKVGVPDRLLTFSHPGIPTLKRGDSLRISLPDESLQQLVYVTSLSFDLSASSFTMNGEVKFTDPIEDAKAARVAAAKLAAAKANKRKTAKKATTGAKKSATATSTSTKAAQHTNKTTAGDRLSLLGHP